MADARTLRRPRLALKLLVDAGHDSQQRRFTSAVGAEDADLRVGIERQPDIVEDDARGRDHLAQTLHDIDERNGHDCSLIEVEQGI